MLDEVLVTNKQSVAARNRYIYYPDHLVRMPGPGQTPGDIISTILFEPLFKGILWGAMKEYFVPKRPDDLSDESVASFFTRRFGRQLPDNLVSAVFHGVYAGDIDQLSIRSILPSLWRYEQWAGSVTRALLPQPKFAQLVEARDMKLVQDIRRSMLDSRIVPVSDRNDVRLIAQSSVYTFRKGIGRLAEKLEEELKASKNVTIKQETSITSIKPLPREGNKVRMSQL